MPKTRGIWWVLGWVVPVAGCSLYVTSFDDTRGDPGDPDGTHSGDGLAGDRDGPAAASPWHCGLDSQGLWTVCRSIGTHSGELMPNLKCIIPAGSDVAQLSQTLPPIDAKGTVGPGDQLLYEVGPGSYETFFVAERLSEYTVRLQLKVFSSEPRPLAACEIRRSFSHPRDWMGTRGGGRDLTSHGGRREVGWLYKDGPFSLGYQLFFPGDTKTDADHFMVLTVPSGQRHHGSHGPGVDDGVVFVSDEGYPGEEHLIQIEHPYARVEWIEMRNADRGVEVMPGGAHAVLSNLLVHGMTVSYGTAVTLKTTATLRHSVVFRASTGVQVSFQTHDSAQRVFLVGNTVVGCMHSGLFVERDSLGVGSVVLQDNILVGNGVEDGTDINDDQSLIETPLSGHNMFGTTGPIGYSRQGSDLVPPPLDSLFVSVDPTAFDLHLKVGAPGTNQGVVPADSVAYPYDTDIDGTIRPAGSGWEMGADEIEE